MLLLKQRMRNCCLGRHTILMVLGLYSLSPDSFAKPLMNDSQAVAEKVAVSKESEASSPTEDGEKNNEKPRFVDSVKWAATLGFNFVYGTDSQETQKTELEFTPELNFRLSNGGKITGIARLRSSNNNLRAEILNPDYASVLSQAGYFGGQTEIELRELYFKKSIGRSYLTLGKQQIVWGKSDGLKVLDVVNPQDLREFILRPFEQSRIPLWTVNFELPLGESTLQFLWVPDKTYNTLASRDSVYAISAPSLVPTPQVGASVVRNFAKRPGRLFEDSDYGLRYTSFKGGWDLSFVYLYHYQDTPVFFQKLVLNPQPTVTINPKYIRSHLIGGAFSKAFGKWVFRSELGYSTDKYFIENLQVSTSGVRKSDELGYVLGLDWSGIENVFISVQLFQSHILNYSPTIIRDRIDSVASILLRKKFRNETVSFELLALHNINNSDGVVRPKLTYDLKDDLRLILSMDVFYGNRNGLFGQFGKNDRVSIGLIFSF